MNDFRPIRCTDKINYAINIVAGLPVAVPRKQGSQAEVTLAFSSMVNVGAMSELTRGLIDMENQVAKAA